MHRADMLEAIRPIESNRRRRFDHPKRQIQRIEMLDGTESVDRSDLATDVWAGRRPDLA